MLQPEYLPVVLPFANDQKQQRQLPDSLVLRISSLAGSLGYLILLFLPYLTNALV